jgi:hypothetical protein
MMSIQFTDDIFLFGRAASLANAYAHCRTRGATWCAAFAARVGLSAPSPSRPHASHSVATVVPLLSLSQKRCKYSKMSNKRGKNIKKSAFYLTLWAYDDE